MEIKKYANGKKIGKCILDERYSIFGVLYLKSIKINSNHKRMGHGSALMQKVNQIILTQDLPGCTYNLIPAHEGKIFIEQFGWKPFSQKSIFYVFNVKNKDKRILKWLENNL